MQASRTLSSLAFGVPAGAWRWAALAFAALALAAAGIWPCPQPGKAGFAGYALLGGIAAVASLLFYAVWPRDGLKTEDARRVAEAAASANVAWAITGADGAVLDCNPVYRRMAGAKDNESAAAAGTGAGGRTSSARALSPGARRRRGPPARGKLRGDARAWSWSPRCVR